MSTFRRPTAEEIRRAAARQAAQATAATQAPQLRNLPNIESWQSRAIAWLLRQLWWLVGRFGLTVLRLFVVVGVHIGVGWFLFQTVTGLNLLGLAFGVLILFGMVATFFSAFAGKAASKATGGLTSSILGAFWEAECNFFRWAVGLPPQKKKKKKDHDEEEDDD